MASRVGNYLLFETLGEGAFGKVKLGVHEETGEQVAVKIMDKSDIKAQEMTMNVRREIAIMKALKHRNIVNLRQVLTSQSKLYIVMDLVTGGELFTKILKEGKLEENTARHYFQQLVDGIEYCHRRGVCHRDLKPENLLIDETTGELKITDFGLSAMKGASTTEELLHTQCGSPNYCAPEIIARHKQGYNGTKVDAWSCGIILFALLAGFLPFYDENTKVLYRMIQRDDVKFPKKFPPEARDLVLRLLHKEPEKRYTLNDVKKHSWFLVDYTGGDADPKSSGGSTASPPTRPKKRRHARNRSIDQGPKSLPTRKKSEKSDRSERSDPDGVISQPPPTTTPLPSQQPTPTHHHHVAQHHQQPPAPPPVIDAPPPGHGRPPVPPPVTSAASPLTPGFPNAPQAPATSASTPRPPTGAPPLPPAVSPKPRSKASSSSSSSAVAAAPPYSAPSYPHRKKRGDRAHRRSRDNFPTISDDMLPQSTNTNVNVIKEQQPQIPIENKSIAPEYPYPAAPPLPPAPPIGTAIPPNNIDLGSNPSFEVAETSTGSAINSSYPPTPAIGNNSDSAKQSDEYESGDVALGSLSGQGNSTTPLPSEASSSAERWEGSSSSQQPQPLPQHHQVQQPPARNPPPVSADNSWMTTDVSRRDVGHSNSSDPIPGMSQPDLSDEPKSESIVERLRAQYSRMATGTSSGNRATPSAGPPMVRREAANESQPTASLPPRFGDRGEVRMKTAYPTTYGAEPAATQIADEYDTRAKQPAAISPLPLLPTQHEEPTPTEETSTNAGVTGMNGNSVANGDSAYDNAEDEVPIKERLTAAVARYRRIFKLGAKIGITASPSFTSNKGNNIGDGSGDDEAKKDTEKSDFFARAKAVTGMWGIILSQGLEDEDSDSEDERQPVTEEELDAFSRLLDFWDNRRASATVTQGSGEVVLDDEEVSPLSEADIAKIQSLLQKLEPKPADDDLKEVEDTTDSQVANEGESETQSEVGAGLEQGMSSDGNGVSSSRTLVDEYAMEGDTSSNAGIGENDVPPAPVPSTPPTKVAHPSDNGYFGNIPTIDLSPQIPPPPPVFDGAEGLSKPTTKSSGNLDVYGPDAIVAKTPSNGVGAGVPGPTVGAGIGAGTGIEGKDDDANSSKGVGVRPKDTLWTPPAPLGGMIGSAAPPTYEAPKVVVAETKSNESSSRVQFGGLPTIARPKTQDGPDLGTDKDTIMGGKRKSSANNSEDHEGRSTMQRVPGRVPSGTSDASGITYGGVLGVGIGANNSPNISSANSTGIGGGTGGGVTGGGGGVSVGSGGGRHGRTISSGEDHAKRGLFTFNMLGRRKSAMTTFDSELMPDECLVEVGKVLIAMGCEVLMKRGENKMKCVARLRNDTLKVSITCSREKKVSHVQFKKGKRDRSQVDAKEFFDFFEVVRSRFVERTGSGDRS